MTHPDPRLVAVCRDCTPPLPMPFDDRPDADAWIAAHVDGTGHDVVIVPGWPSPEQAVARASRVPQATFERCESCATLVATSTNSNGSAQSMIERWGHPLPWENPDVVRSALVHTPDRCRAIRGVAR